jgi:hypothetical protein
MKAPEGFLLGDGIFYAEPIQEQSEDMIAPHSLDFLKLQKENNQ